ncbi:MAG: hemerythrin domain-containing protein [Desulfurivibrionaceae bacterium]
MGPIEELKNEHRAVETMLKVIEVVAARYARGRGINTRDFNAILEFLIVFLDRCHHGKEEDFLFPALESAGVTRAQSPIGDLLQEHEQARHLVEELRDAAGNFISGYKTAANRIENAGIAYVTLLNRHIEKEENDLFPMAADMLGPDKQAELSAAFEQIEEELIGPGKHEEFHQLLHRLEQTYTSQGKSGA